MPDITRRSFVELLTGTIVALPTLAGGLIVAPRKAYSEDGASDATVASQLAGLESEYVVIDVVQPWEVGLQVVDVSKGKKNDAGMVSYPPVKGAHVIVTSRYNQKTVSGDTNDSGFVNLDIRDLSLPRETDADANDYHFNGSVTVTCDNYRNFKTALLVVQGGTGLQVPAHPIDGEGTPYPQIVSFDEWDALYGANDFAVSPKNTIDHTIAVNLLGLPGTEQATVELWVQDEKTPRASAKASPGEREQVGVRVERVIARYEKKQVVVDYDLRTLKPVYLEVDEPVYEDKRTPVYGRPVTATFTAPFLKEGDNAALPIGAKLSLVVTQGKTTWKWPLAATTSKAVVPEPAAKEKTRLQPINTNISSTTALDVRWPDSVPVLGGSYFKPWLPSTPVDIYVNPYGLIQITVTVASWGYVNDNGKDAEGAGWGKYPRKSVEDQWNKKIKTMQDMEKKYNKVAPNTSWKSGIQKIDSFYSISSSVNFNLIALAKWNSEKELFQGEIGGQIYMGMSLSYTQNFFAGPIPVLITFAFDGSLIVGLTAAAYVAKSSGDKDLLSAVLDFSRWKWDYANTGLSMTINLTPSLSVGVGVRGIASISIKGMLTLTVFMGIPLGTQPKNLPNPHITVGWSAQIALVIELFFFTQSFALYNKPFANFSDNWNGKDPGIEAQADEGMPALQALADKSLDELLGELVPITDEMLARTSEATLSAQAIMAQADERAIIDWGVLAQSDGEARALSDGLRVRYGQMSMRCPDGTTMALPTYELWTDDSQGTPLEAQADVAADAVSWLMPMATDTLPTPGVAGLGAAGGVRPSSDVRLFGSDDRHVLSAAHTKVVDLGSGTGQTGTYGIWSFRIASVEVGGNPRTRLVANCLYGNPNGSTKVVEFDTRLDGMPHGELYDYDFDVLVRKEKELRNGASVDVNVLCVTVLSGKRAGDDSTKLATVATELSVTYLNMSADSFVAGGSNTARPEASQCVSMKASDVANVDTSKYHSISNLQIIPLGSDVDGWETCAVAFLDRCAAQAEDVVGTSDQVSVRPGFINVFRQPVKRPNWMRVALFSTEQWDQYLAFYNPGFADPTVYEMVVYPGIISLDAYDKALIMMLRGAKQAHYVPLMVVDDSYQWDDSEGGSVVYRGPSIGWPQKRTDLEPDIRLVPCPAQGYFLTSYPTDPNQLKLPTEQRDYVTWALHKVSWRGQGGTAVPVFEPFGPSGFNVVNFSVNPAGTFLFWPHSRDADEDRVWDADGKEDVQKREAVYQIMACRLRGERYSDPFVVADLTNDTDFLAVMSVNPSSVMEALRTVYVDTGERNKENLPLYHAADIYYTAVPAVRCVTATACVAPSPFVCPGGEIIFHVAVRNDGNTFLSGCTLELCVHDEGSDGYQRVPGASAKVTFGAETIKESTYNPLGSDGKLEGVADDYALAPGKTSVYGIKVSVPKDWSSGEKKVLFVASDGVLASDYLAAQAEDDSEPEVQEFHVEPGEYHVISSRTHPDQNLAQRHMERLTVNEAVAGGHRFQPAPVTGSDSGEQTVDAPSSAGGNALATRRDTLPNTGDATSGAAGLLGAGLAAVGGAVYAYERRRAKNDGHFDAGEGPGHQGAC